MRLSTSTNIHVYDRGKNYSVRLEDSIRLCADAGYRYIDINLCGQCRGQMPMAGDDWEEWIDKIRDLGGCLGVQYTQAHAPFPVFEEALVREDRSRPEAEHFDEMMRRCVKAANVLGVEWMVVHPFTVVDESGYSPKKSAVYNREYYARWGEIFADSQVGMAIENMSGNWYFYQYGTTAEELLDLAEAIDNPRVKICLDTGHAHLAGRDVAGMVHMMGRELRALHINDNHGGKKDEHIAPYSGTINWEDVMCALGALDYHQDFSFEIQNMTGCYPKEVQAELVAFSYHLGQYLMSLAEKQM